MVIRPKERLWWDWWRIHQTNGSCQCPCFYQRLNPEIQIVGTGGVLTGRDAFEHYPLWGLVWCKSERHSIKKELERLNASLQELKAIMEEKRLPKPRRLPWQIALH